MDEKLADRNQDDLRDSLETNKQEDTEKSKEASKTDINLHKPSSLIGGNTLSCYEEQEETNPASHDSSDDDHNQADEYPAKEVDADIPIEQGDIDLDYCLVILEKIINPLTKAGHIKLLLEDLMDCVDSPERKALAMRMADPSLDQVEKRKLLIQFKTFDVKAETGRKICKEVQFQSVPFGIIPRIEPDLSVDNFPGQRENKIFASMPVVTNREKKENKIYKIELKLSLNNKRHTVKIRRCNIKIKKITKKRNSVLFCKPKTNQEKKRGMD